MAPCLFDGSNRDGAHPRLQDLLGGLRPDGQGTRRGALRACAHLVLPAEPASGGLLLLKGAHVCRRLEELCLLMTCLLRERVHPCGVGFGAKAADDGLLPKDSDEHPRVAVTIPCVQFWSGFYETTWAAYGQSGAPAVAPRNRSSTGLCGPCHHDRRESRGRGNVESRGAAYPVGSRWFIRRFCTGPQSEPHGHVSSSGGLRRDHDLGANSRTGNRVRMEIPPYGWALIGVVGTTVGVVLLLPDLRSLWWTFQRVQLPWAVADRALPGTGADVRAGRWTPRRGRSESRTSSPAG